MGSLLGAAGKKKNPLTGALQSGILQGIQGGLSSRIGGLLGGDVGVPSLAGLSPGGLVQSGQQAYSDAILASSAGGQAQAAQQFTDRLAFEEWRERKRIAHEKDLTEKRLLHQLFLQRNDFEIYKHRLAFEKAMQDSGFGIADKGVPWVRKQLFGNQFGDTAFEKFFKEYGYFSKFFDKDGGL